MNRDSSQIPLENTCVGVSFSIKLPIMKKTFERLLLHELHIHILAIGRAIYFISEGRQRRRG